jgi:hypothetical protein
MKKTIIAVLITLAVVALVIIVAGNIIVNSILGK